MQILKQRAHRVRLLRCKREIDRHRAKQRRRARRAAELLEGEGDFAQARFGHVGPERTQTLIRQADVVVVRFGGKYKQWNAAFDAGFAAALGKPIVTLHDPETTHALKEIGRAAMATAETPEQVVEILLYVLEGKLSAGA